MSILETLRGRLRGARHSRSQKLADPYWSAVASLAAGAEPSNVPALADAMEILGKSEDDLPRDATLLVELEESEARAALLAPSTKASEKAGAARHAAELKAAAMRDEAKRLVETASNAFHVARCEMDACEQAGRRAQDIRRQLAAGGHPKYAKAVEAIEESNHLDANIRDLEARLRSAKTELENVNGMIELHPQEQALVAAANRRQRAVDEIEAQLHGLRTTRTNAMQPA
jgi:hypothetical protein